MLSMDSGPSSVPASVEKKRWQSNVRSLQDGMSHIFETKDFWDVQFSMEGRTFKAHRLILAARCPEFEKLLFGEDAVKEHTFPDVSETGFEILLRYIYTNSMGKVNDADLLKVYRVATRFQQQDLLGICEERLAQWEIKLDNVAALLNQLSSIESVRQRCMNFVRDNQASFLLADGLLAANQDTVFMLFDVGYFKAVPPLQKLESVLRWASNQFPPQDNYTLVREILLQGSKPLMGRIGIQELGNVDLAKVVAKYKDLLAPDECTAFFTNAVVPGAMPLPEWCEREESA